MENNNKPSEISPLVNEYGARYASSTPLFDTSNRRSEPPEVSDHYTMTNQLNPSELQYDCNYYEIEKYAGMANDVNMMAQMSQQNAGYYNNHGSVSNENLNMGRSYHQSFFNDGMNGSNIPFTQLLLMGNAAFTASANSNLSTSIGMAAKRPLLPKVSPLIHSDGENNNNSWLTDQNYNSGSAMFSKLDKIITPEVHSQVDNGVRDSNQNHYSSSTCLNNEVSQYSLLTTFQPGCDLNSTETAESDAFSSVCNPVQFTPTTPNKANLWESNQHPAVKKYISIPEKEGSLVPHKADETIEQAHSNQLLESVVDSSCAIIQTPTMETTDDDKKISMGVDLNRTPELKPAKRRKHRPKVIVEGKLKRTPKTVTSKTKEPKQNSTSKRKYASKDGSKDPRTPKADVARKTKELDDASASKSCRRVLNFDIKKAGENQETIFNEQELQQKYERALNMTLDSQATELPNGTDCVIRVMSVPQSGTHKKLMMGNQKTTNACMTSPLMNQIFSDSTSMLEREAASPPLAATEDIQTNDQIFLGRREKNKKAKQPWKTWRNGYKPMKQEKHAELLTGVLENNCQNLEKEKQLKTLPNSFQPETAGGENTDSINTRNPLGSLLCKGVLEMNNHRNGCTQRTQFSQTYKRRKTKIDYTNSYIKPSNFTAAKDLGKVQINRSNSGCQNLHALNADPTVLNCYFESIRTPQRRNDVVNKLINESFFQSITSTDNANQQVSAQLQLHTNVMAPPTLSHFYGISCQPITEKCNNLQPSHSIGQGHNQPYQNCNNNVPVEKQTGKMLQEQIAPCGNQPPLKKIRGRKKQQIQPMSIDMIIHLFKNLSLNEISNRRQMQEYGILVPYKGDSAMVPYERFEFNKKRKARPKVNLDPETDRIWKLLMGSEGVEGTNKDKEKWWEEERKVFHGRVDSFIARMHLVQGDRRFSRWKGSVVDSVIGVFLTQNVSDHLSSSAFMSMAARFPLKSISTTKENVRANELNKEAEICVIHQDDSTEKQENLSDVIHNQKSIIPSESCGHQSKETSETDRSLLESQCQSLQEEFISSQDSFDSRNSQSIGGIRSCSGSNSEAEDPSTIGKPTQKNVSSSIDFLEMRKITNFGEHYCHNNGGCKNGQSEVGPLKSGSERMRHLNYLPSLMYSTSLDHQCMKVPVNPTIKNELSMKQKIQVPEMGCFETFSEESTTSSPSNSSTLIKGKEKDLNIISRQDFDVSSAEQNRLWGSQEMPTKDHYGFLSKDATENKRISQQHESQNECIGYGDFKLKNASTMEPRKLKRTNVDKEKMDSIDWDNLRKQVEINGPRKETEDTMDSLDYEAVRCAHVKEISDAIKERGMNNRLAERMQEFLNRLIRDHGSINLEWLRDVPPDKAKDYLLSMRGLGLKSVECVRLLTLHHVAFPVDTNVGRIAVRLGWVPLQPLPESLQLHLLELYPILETIQKYLWPRLCKLDQRTLYELHYQMITFGKVFCTKSKPNCNACPMRAECRHFASAFASARLALPGPEEKRIIHTTVPVAIHKTPHASMNLISLPPPENNSLTEANSKIGTCEPIIEEPATPEEEHTEISERDIEDLFYEDPDEIPTIKLNIEEFSVTLQNYMHNSMEIQEGDLSKALVALNQEAASIPTPKLKNISRLRTEHQVYELPDSHPILEGLERREPDDPSPYLLAIWVPGETVNSIEPPERRCNSQETGTLCSEKTCFSCSSVREADSQTVRATILIPCRTAMRGSFPLNGTYFQVNEMFADHDSSLNPINVPRQSIWNLPRRTVYFGTSVSSIFRGLSTEAIQYCFWRGFVCVRGFDRMTRAPRPLIARLHFPASKLAKAKK